MNNPQAQGSQQPPAQQGQPQLIKAEDLPRLSSLTEDQKQKYRIPLANLWQVLQTKPQNSPEHLTARNKLAEWSAKLIQQERSHRAKAAAANRPQGQVAPNAQGQPSASQQQNPQGQSQQQPQQSSQQQQQQQQQQPQQQQLGQKPPQQAASNMQAPQQNPQQPPINPEIIKHVQQFPYHLSPQGPQAGTIEGDQRLKELRHQYLKLLNQQEQTTHRAKALQVAIEEHKKAGREVPLHLLQKKSQLEQEYPAAKQRLDEFRKTQSLWKSQQEQLKLKQQQQQQPPQGQQQQQGLQQQQAQQAQHPPQQPPSQQQQQQQQQQPQQQPQPKAASQTPQPQAQQLPQQPPQNVPQVKQEPQIKVEGGANPAQPKPFANVTTTGNISSPHGTQTPVSGHPVMSQPPARAPQSAGIHPPQPMSAGPFTQTGQPMSSQPQRPQINPQQANAHAQHQQHNSPHPQSATSGPPVPLSHQAAVTAAQRSYSNQEPQRTMTPQQMSHQGSFNGGRGEPASNTTKMPIPRTLNVTQPVPVNMGPARPTLAGPNGAAGMLGQPVMAKWPQFQLEGEGDRVLSKRKLDELVRQVTGGGGDGPNGEALTPEVEEAMLQLADDFVDTVITNACKLSKLRESPHLDVRDIQLVLERNYNIRIPGFASDEVRTVRKLHPAPGWTQKMNAVQAAKVMGGKTDI